MSGHSKWSTIKRQKGAKDAARGALFTKLGNNIAVAARSGADLDTNFALRLAVDKAKVANMPTANIQRSIDRGSGKLGGEQIREVMYEGYGPGGVAILVECGEPESIIYTDPKELAKVRDALKAAGLVITEAELTYVPNNTVAVTDAATAGKIMRLMDALDAQDDVTNTHVNFDIPEELLSE